MADTMEFERRNSLTNEVASTGPAMMAGDIAGLVDEIADAFIEKFAAKVKTMHTGEPREGATPQPLHWNREF